MDSGDRVLDIKDFNNVFQKCQNFAANWRRLGSTLGIAKNAIDIIAENNPRNVTDCMSAVISKWLQRTDTEKGKPKPSWRVLCDAIATIDVAAAEKIAQDIGFTYTGAPDTSPGLNETTPIASSRDRSTNISLNVLRSHFGDLCGLLNISQPTLHSLTLELFAKGVIDMKTKIDVVREGGATGADNILTLVLKKVEDYPEHLDVVQKAFEKEQLLHDIIETMKRESMDEQ